MQNTVSMCDKKVLTWASIVVRYDLLFSEGINKIFDKNIRLIFDNQH